MGLITGLFKYSFFAMLVLLAGHIPVAGKSINNHVGSLMSSFNVIGNVTSNVTANITAGAKKLVSKLNFTEPSEKVSAIKKAHPEVLDSERAKLNSILRKR